MQHASQSILRTHITGTMSEEERDNAARETIRAMRQNPISNAIWDLRGAKLANSLIGSHLAVLDLPCLGLKKADSIALVFAHDREQHRHAKTVAHSRGITNINNFTDLQEGIQWLVTNAWAQALSSAGDHGHGPPRSQAAYLRFSTPTFSSPRSAGTSLRSVLDLYRARGTSREHRWHFHKATHEPPNHSLVTWKGTWIFDRRGSRRWGFAHFPAISGAME
jgi:hypothetical protein